MIRSMTKEKLTVKIYENRDEMGIAAANDVAEALISLLSQKEEVNMIFAAAPSQNELYKYLVEKDCIDWHRVNAFNLDDYIGLPADAPQLFANFLVEHIFSKLQFKSVNLLQTNTTDAQAECDRYADLLKKHPTDIACLGIGENGHLAFNDPSVADFEDKYLVKIVELELACRQQQVNDGCFAALEDVPTHAMTLTMPALLSTNTNYISVVVPASTKADAVYRTLNDEISTACPSTILRRYSNATLYLDPDSAKRI